MSTLLKEKIQRYQHGIWVSVFFFGFVFGFIAYTHPRSVSSDEVKHILSACLSFHDAAYIGCLRSRFRPILRLSSIKKILHDIDELTSADGEIETPIEAVCHEVGHVLGEEMAKMHIPAAHLVSYCGTSCGYGCTHGIIYTKAREDPRLMDNLDQLCTGTKQDPVSFVDQDNCTHGIGHFLTEYVSYDLKKSLELCRTRVPSMPEQCMSGAIMEMFAQKDQQEAPWTFPTDVGAYCVSLPEYAQHVCVGLLSSMKPEATIHEGMVSCQKMPPTLLDSCILGKAEKVYRVANGDVSMIIDICNKEAPYTSTCIEGAVSTAFNMDSSGEMAKNICDQLSGQLAVACREHKEDLEKRSVR